MTATITTPGRAATIEHRGFVAWFRRRTTATASDATVRVLEHELTQAVIKLSGADQLIRDQQQHIADLTAQLEQAAADRVDDGVREQQHAAAQADIEALTKENLKLRAEIQNLGSISPLPMHRDPSMPEPVLPAWQATLAARGYPADDPDVETTQQIQVTTLTQAAARGAL